MLTCGTSTTADLLAVVNSNEQAIKAYLIAQGYSGQFGFFLTGFTYTQAGDVGITSTGEIWTWNGAFPQPVAPGTVPSEPDYSQVDFKVNEAVNVALTGGGTVQNFVDAQRFADVATAASYADVESLLNHRVYIEGTGAWYTVALTSSVTPNTLSIFESTADATYSFVEDTEKSQTVTQTLVIAEDANYKASVNLKDSSISLTGQKTLTTSASDIARGDDVVTVAAANFSAGDCVVIEGTIGHEDYTPSRFTGLAFVAKVRHVDGLGIKLDRMIDFIATGVTVSKIPNISVTFEGDLESSSIALTNIFSAKYKGRCTGSVGSGAGQSFVSVSNAGAVDIDIEFDNAEAVLCLVNNNVSSGTVKIESRYSGGESVIGGVGASSKVYRANAIQDMTIDGNFVSSKNVDSTIYAARNITCNFKSHGGGQNFFDVGDTDPNRLESVQFSEGDRVTLNGHMIESNDQCAEMLACTESTINGFYANGVNTVSSEGAVVVKGAGRDVTVNATVKGYGSRGVKFELFDGGFGFRTSATSDIRSDSTHALIIRDAQAAYDCRCQVRGSFAGVGSEIIDVRENSDGVTVDATVNMANATAGVAMKAADWNASVHGINTQVNKNVLSIGGTASDFNIVKVTGETDDIFMQFNGASESLFKMAHLNGLHGRALFGAASQSFTMKGGQAYANDVPTVGIFTAGDSYARDNYNIPANTESLFGGTYRRVEIGRIYDGSGNWVQQFGLFEVV